MNNEVKTRKLVKKYYIANDALIDFVENGNKKPFDRFASEAGVSARTVVRMRKKERISRSTVGKIFAAATRAGLTLGFEEAFLEVSE